MTLRQVIESLLSLRNSARVENLITTRGVQFQSSPAILDILKEFGASPKLLSLIPQPPPAPEPPEPVAPKAAGPLNIVCEPTDCLVVVDTHSAVTTQKKTTLTGLKPGEIAVQVFANGYEPVNRKIELEEGKPFDVTFRLSRTELYRQQAASSLMVKALAALGGTDGVSELADIDGEGMLTWTDSAGKGQDWPITFKKRVGSDLRITFKPKDGQCTATILGQSAKQDCRNSLRGSGENIAAQATSLFLSYQLQDVLQALMNRTLITSENNEDRLESPGARDAYALTLSPEGLPANLIYRADQKEGDVPIQVQYSNYLKVNKGQYPGRVAIGRMNAAPVFVFTITSIRSSVLLTKN
jgi:hypothetical protein